MPSQTPKKWLARHRAARDKALRGALRRLRSGGVPSADQLTGAMLEALRLDSEDDLEELIVLMEDEDVQVCEDCLTSAWCQAQALRWPLSWEIQTMVLRFLREVRWKMSARSQDASCCSAGRGAVWDRVDQLVGDAKRLLRLLDTLVEAGEAGEADEAVTLAMCIALAIRDVKGDLRRSYGSVPWEETEFLLALFVEAHTVFVTLAFVVASAGIIRTHLRYFLGKVHELDREVPLEAMKTAPRGERVEWVQRVTKTGGGMADILDDFALLRDWRSLKSICDALTAALEALALPGQDWEEWGWLALRRGLFVAGEKMKNSWESPNLSARYASLFEAMAPEGALSLLRYGIRDALAHSKVSGSADAADMTDKKRVRLREDLQRLLLCCKYILRQAGVCVLRKKKSQAGSDEHQCRFCLSFELEYDVQSDGVYKQVLSMLEEAHKGNDKGKPTLDSEFENLTEELKTYFLTYSDKTNVLEYGYGSRLPSASEVDFELMYVRNRVYDLVKQHFLHLFSRIHKLMSWKGAEGLSSFQADLNDLTAGDRVSNHSESTTGEVERAISALKTVPRDERAPWRPLHRYAVEGALRELADSWPDDHAALTLEPRAPALFGRQLRNYLHHGDLTIQLCFNADIELRELWLLILEGTMDPRLGVGHPPLRDTGKSSQEQLRLSRLKDEMFRAARQGDLASLLRAAEVGADISCADCRGRTLLHAAAEAGQDGVLEWLLACQAADPLAQDWAGFTALHNAANSRVAEKLLFEHYDAFLSPLINAARFGRTDVLRVLLPRFDPNAVVQPMSALNCAAFGGHDDAVRLLLQAGARLDRVPENPTLSAAAFGGSAATLRLLLRPPPPLLPQLSDVVCWKAAGIAILQGHAEASSVLMGELLERGAQPDCPEARAAVASLTKCDGTAVAVQLLDLWPEAVHAALDEDITLLHVAARDGRADLVAALLLRGADPLRRCRQGWTALTSAAMAGSVDVINALWEHEQRGKATLGGEQPLMHVAAEHGHLEAVKRLVELGADINAGSSGCTHATPLYRAALEGRAAVVEWLLGQGARVHGDAGTWSPLHAAVMRGHLAVAELLLPEPNKMKKALHRSRLELLQAVDSETRTPLHLAALSGSPALVKLLLQRELQLLEKHYNSKRKAGQIPEWKNLTVYRRDDDGLTPLDACVVWDAPSAMLRVLLRHMEDERVMALGGKDVKEVHDMLIATMRSRLVVYHCIFQGDRAVGELLMACMRLRERMPQGLFGELSGDRLA